MGIDIAEFINDGGGSIASQKITFIAWDFAGQVWSSYILMHVHKPYPFAFCYFRKNTSLRIIVLLFLGQSTLSAAKPRICLSLV